MSGRQGGQKPWLSFHSSEQHWSGIVQKSKKHCNILNNCTAQYSFTLHKSLCVFPACCTHVDTTAGKGQLVELQPCSWWLPWEQSPLLGLEQPHPDGRSFQQECFARFIFRVFILRYNLPPKKKNCVFKHSRECIPGKRVVSVQTFTSRLLNSFKE